MRSFEFVTLATLSRIITLCLSIGLDLLVQDHNPQVEEFYIANLTVVGTLCKTFVKWDSVHFLTIAVDGYSQAYQHAFLPAFPVILRTVGKLVSVFGFSNELSIIIGGVVFANIVFIISIAVLCHFFSQWQLSQRVCLLATVAFCFNPASIFFSTLYSESLYMVLLWFSILYIERPNPTAFHIFVSTVSMFCSCCIKSNGIVGIIFLVHKCALLTLRNGAIAKPVFLILSSCTLVIPLIVVNKIAKHRFCNHAYQYQILLHPTERINLLASMNCENHEEYVNFYGIIQRQYWNVGLFRYFEFGQIPNFLLAMPITIIAIWTIMNMNLPIKTDDLKTLHLVKGILRAGGLPPGCVAVISNTFMCPHKLHLLFLLIIGICVANVQITTRLICSSCPVIYVGMGQLLARGSLCEQRLVIIYLATYLVIGTALHVNFYPWT